MTPQAARALVERYFALMGAGGDLREVLAPDIVWHLPRTNPMGTPIRGLDAVLEMLGRGVDLYASDAEAGDNDRGENVDDTGDGDDNGHGDGE